MPTPTVRSARRGFTLLELMLVVLIIGLLMGVSTWAILSQGESARVKTTEMSLRSIQSVLTKYNLDHGTFPPTLQALVPTYTDKVPTDAWKNPLKYFVPGTGGKPFSLYSEGKPGENKRIDLWTIEANK
jgi:general secretion pathway protein G